MTGTTPYTPELRWRIVNAMGNVVAAFRLHDDAINWLYKPGLRIEPTDNLKLPFEPLPSDRRVEHHPPSRTKLSSLDQRSFS